MASKTVKGKTLSVTAYRGDAKTLLAFNLPKAKTTRLAGFTIQCQPGTSKPYYLFNNLRFEKPERHAQVPEESSNSTVNAPLHKFRWIHVPGMVHQELTPFFGKYTYTVTPRYFDANRSMQALDPGLSVAVSIEVAPFRIRQLELGFTRGYTQSQAFVRHFGLKAKISPTNAPLLFDTTQVSGQNAQGKKYSFEDEYEWLGFTARDAVFGILNEVLGNQKLRLDMFGYDLGEPDMMKLLLKLAKTGQVRIILDNAALHHDSAGSKREDRFEREFRKVARKGSAIMRGKYGRYAHHKVFIVSNQSGPRRVLTGSTNFSVTGMYVNSNHVLVFNDTRVARWYADVFEESWTNKVSAPSFRKSALSTTTFSTTSARTPRTEVTFAPHDDAGAAGVLDDVVTRIKQEGKKGKSIGSVLFAVMGLEGSGPVYPALKTIHQDNGIFSYGISDDENGIKLYRPRDTRGVLVTGKPGKTRLPPPFNQVPTVGLGHQIHHKYVVCGFNGDNPVVFCGSSNLALGGEKENGDNLLAIRDTDVATVFAIEALLLVDHFDFLGRHREKAKAPKNAAPPPTKADAAATAGWWLSTTGKWAEPYYAQDDLRSVDRVVFG
jgi:hypothetical protein